jgi:predicted transcriptional regulator
LNRFHDFLNYLRHLRNMVRELGHSGADVARYLGVTNSCVTRFVASEIKPDVDDLIEKI